MLEESKGPLKSITIWAAILNIALKVFALWTGYEISDEVRLKGELVLEQAIVLYPLLASFVMDLVGIWGRWRATERIK